MDLKRKAPATQSQPHRETSQNRARGKSSARPPLLFVYFDAVARHGSIRKAAEQLFIASSALNRRILELEAELGTPLFERLPRGVKLTAAGEIFFHYVRRARRARRAGSSLPADRRPAAAWFAAGSVWPRRKPCP